MIAARDGYSIVRLLLDRKDVEVDTLVPSDWTALMLIVAYGYEAVVGLLLGHGDVSVRSREEGPSLAGLARSPAPWDGYFRYAQ
jgi:ankyrin repeat protein